LDWDSIMMGDLHNAWSNFYTLLTGLINNFCPIARPSYPKKTAAIVYDVATSEIKYRRVLLRV